MEDMETYSTDGAVCPHCGHLNDPSNDNYSLYDESTTSWECGGCEKPFTVSVYVRHSWTCTAAD